VRRDGHPECQQQQRNALSQPVHGGNGTHCVAVGEPSFTGGMHFRRSVAGSALKQLAKWIPQVPMATRPVLFAQQTRRL